LVVLWIDDKPYVKNGGYYLEKTEQPLALKIPITNHVVHYMCQVVASKKASYGEILEMVPVGILFDAEGLNKITAVD
jgi:hypothetical protein